MNASSKSRTIIGDQIVASAASTFKEEFFLRCFDLARMGKSDEEIAGTIGVRLHQLRRWMRGKPPFNEAIHRGRLESRTVREADQPIYEEAGVGKIYQVPYEHKDLSRAQVVFLTVYTATGMIGKAAEAADIQPHTHQTWLLRYPAYKKAFRHAENVVTDRIEDAAYKRAVEGVMTKKFHEGREVMEMCGPDDPNAIRFFDESTNRPYYLRPYIEHKYSDSLTALLLRGRKPKRYRDQPDVKLEQHTTNNHLHIDLNDVLTAVRNGRGSNVLEADSVHVKAQQMIDAHRASNATVEVTEATDVE